MAGWLDELAGWLFSLALTPNDSFDSVFAEGGFQELWAAANVAGRVDVLVLE